LVFEKKAEREASKCSKIYNANSYNLDLAYKDSLLELRKKAREYRTSTKKILLEAAFRRAPSLRYAKDASRIALEEGWNGTSNLAAFFDYLCPLDLVGGTMAHSFVMSHRDEFEAYMLWNRVFPNSTFLIDTYDVMNAVEFFVRNKIKPSAVRIDSDPLGQLPPPKGGGLHCL